MPRKTAAAAPADDLGHAPPETRLIPLDQLYLHPLNPRQEPPAAEIEALAQSIAALGLIQNLSGFADHQIRFRDGFPDANPEHTGIVAGGRRLRALQLLASRGEWTGPVPVQVTTDPDMAAQWAGAENETQRELPIADRIAAYATMRRQGHSVEGIASAFGTPLSDVRRLLALATLPDAALDALRAGRIKFEVARALTTAPSAQVLDQALKLALNGAQPWQVNELLRKGTVTSTDRRAVYVGLAAYHDAGGSSTLDLFAEATILHDEGLLDRLMLEKATAETEALRAAEGWAWAEFAAGDVWTLTANMHRLHQQPVELPEGDAARMDELAEIEDRTDVEEQELIALETRADVATYDPADIATGGIVTKVNHLGQLVIEGAYRRPGDRAAEAGAEGGDDIGIAPAAPEAAMPQNLRDDLRRIRLICIQDALRECPALMLDMLALQLTRRLRPWENPFALDQTHAAPPEKRDGMTIPAALADPCEKPADHQPGDAARVLADWMQADARTVIDPALHNGLARAFCRTDGPFVDLIHARRPINARNLWHPTPAGFLSRVSAAYLDALWRDLVPDEGSRHAGFTLSPKKEKVRELDQLFNGHELREALGLSRDQCARIDAWLPEELRFGAPETAED